MAGRLVLLVVRGETIPETRLRPEVGKLLLVRLSTRGGCAGGDLDSRGFRAGARGERLEAATAGGVLGRRAGALRLWGNGYGTLARDRAHRRAATLVHRGLAPPAEERLEAGDLRRRGRTVGHQRRSVRGDRGGARPRSGRGRGYSCCAGLLQHRARRQDPRRKERARRLSR